MPKRFLELTLTFLFCLVFKDQSVVISDNFYIITFRYVVVNNFFKLNFVAIRSNFINISFYQNTVNLFLKCFFS